MTRRGGVLRKKYAKRKHPNNIC